MDDVVAEVDVPNVLRLMNGYGNVLMPKSVAERQLPFFAKQPEVILKPTFDVDVAEPDTLRPLNVVVPKPVPETERNLVALEDEATSKIGLVCADAA